MLRFTVFLSFLMIFVQGWVPCSAQGERLSVGLVLTGGGARGAAHVGVIQALEDSGIPIDYVVGTSVGALVGGYYAAGWSPEAMWELLRTDEFNARISGEPLHEFQFKSLDQFPSALELRLGARNRDVRGHLISSLPLDWSLMEELGPASARAGSSFDSLMVPFRCVGSDVLAKSDTVFSRGDLAQAVRASMSFPFYLNPIWLDGKPIYDGGLYNNRPIDVMIECFAPDIILLSGTESEPSDFLSDDLLTQIEALIIRPTEFSNEGDIALFEIVPDLKLGTLDFGQSIEACEQGYSKGLEFVELHGAELPRVAKTESVALQRGDFVRGIRPFAVIKTQISGLDFKQREYAHSIIRGHKEEFAPSELKRRLFLLESDQYIGRVYPKGQAVNGGFAVNVDVSEARDFKVDLGGGLSSQPLSMGYAAVGLSHFGRIPMRASVSTAFGAFYSDIGVRMNFDFHGDLPTSLQPIWSFRQWNYARDLAGFLERDVRPIFCNSQESEWGGVFLISSGLRSKLNLSFLQFNSIDQTYADWIFSSNELTNIDRYKGSVLGLSWKRKSLNHNQYPTKGHHFNGGVKRFQGTYKSDFNVFDDSLQRMQTINEDVFWRGNVHFESYVSVFESGALGLTGNACFSNESLRSTYNGTIVQATAYAPMPGSRSVFLENFRAFNYLALGAIADCNVLKGIHLRSEIHAFKAGDRIENGAKGPRLNPEAPLFWMAGFRAWKEMPFGPLSLGIEYYKSERSPLFFEMLLGYRLFQESPRR